MRLHPVSPLARYDLATAAVRHVDVLERWHPAEREQAGRLRQLVADLLPPPALRRPEARR